MGRLTDRWTDKQRHAFRQAFRQAFGQAGRQVETNRAGRDRQAGRQIHMEKNRKKQRIEHNKFTMAQHYGSCHSDENNSRK